MAAWSTGPAVLGRRAERWRPGAGLGARATAGAMPVSRPGGSAFGAFARFASDPPASPPLEVGGSAPNTPGRWSRRSCYRRSDASVAPRRQRLRRIRSLRERAAGFAVFGGRGLRPQHPRTLVSALVLPPERCQCRAPPACVLACGPEARHGWRPREDRLHRAAQRAGALPVDDPHLEDAARAA